MNIFNHKLILDHLSDRDYSHVELVLRSGGMEIRDVYIIILNLIDLGCAKRIENKKFKYIKEI